MSASKKRIRHPGGFTLVELMVVVAIIGLLASVAIPQFTRATLRSRAAERLPIMQAIGSAVNTVVLTAEHVPNGALAGELNPPGDPGPMKRRFDWTMAGWNAIPMVVEGDSYYSYRYAVAAPQAPGDDETLTVWSWGDLDGDGEQSPKDLFYRGVGNAFMLYDEHPARGAEDQDRF